MHSKHEDSNEPQRNRRIRSYARRQGRITAAQRESLKTLSQHFCLAPDRCLNVQEAFSRTAPLTLEIGFGNGESLVETAVAHPQNDYLGIEVHRPGVGHLMWKLAQQAIPNVRIYCADAVDVMQRCLPDTSLAEVNLFFPDPWPKKRHHKRRLVNSEFIDLIVQKLQPGGCFHTATDWEDYALSMLALLNANRQLRNIAPSGSFMEHRRQRPLTKFEQRGIGLGHRIWDLIYRRV